MANTLLSAQTIARKSAMILHQKLNFIGNVNRQYDDTYSLSGAQRGDTAKIRIPAKYLGGDGAAITPEDTTQTSVPLTLSHQYRVPAFLTTKELSLSVDDFTMQVAEPAMSQLASLIESGLMAEAYRGVYNEVGTAGTIPAAALTYLQANGRLTEGLAPTSKRCIVATPDAHLTVVDANKGLFQSSSEIASQYREGRMGTGLGMEWYENTLVPIHTNGNKVAGVTVSASPTEGSSTITFASLAAADTFKAGTVFTIANVNRVHPESKVTTGKLQQFVITADATSAGATLAVTVSPAFFSATSGAQQNITALPAAAAAVTIVGAASSSLAKNIAFHKDAFVFATADLVMPNGVDMKARAVMDGISVRFVRQYEIGTDRLISRWDVLCGLAVVRPELAVRITQ